MVGEDKHRPIEPRKTARGRAKNEPNRARRKAGRAKHGPNGARRPREDGQHGPKEPTARPG
eukprot:7640809-Karenia_brevis.AAC.1